jgi:hypothetical protein
LAGGVVASEGDAALPAADVVAAESGGRGRPGEDVAECDGEKRLESMRRNEMGKRGCV